MRFNLSWPAVLAMAGAASVCLTCSAAKGADGSAAERRLDWPCWRGPYGSGAAQDCGEAVVTNLSDARLVWLSEARTYQAYPEGGRGPFLYSGQGGPVVADGRVFLFYLMPDAKVYAATAEDTLGNVDFDPRPLGFEDRMDVARRHYSITAEDTLLCADAKNGKTLWKRSIAGGINYGGRRAPWYGTKCGPLQTPCAAYGKVYFAGTTLRVFCLDAKTGETVWENNLGAKHKELVAARDAAIAAKDLWKLPINWFLGGHCPAFADGVVVFDDEMGSVYGGGLVAFDAESGKELWRLPPGINSYPGPLRWVDAGDSKTPGQGKEYFVSGRGALIEPRTGKVLWGPFGSAQPLVLWGDYMLTCLGDKQAAGWECRRISPGKAELVWKRGGMEYGAGGFATPVVQKGRLIWANGMKYYSLDMATGEGLVASIGGPAGLRTSCSLIGTDGTALQENAAALCITDDGRFAAPNAVWEPRHTVPGQGGVRYCNSTTGAIVDGFWFFRALDSLACVQLRRNLHAKVLSAGDDTGRILALCGDPDPAVKVDAVMALRAKGDLSAPVIEGLVRLLDEPRYGACLRATDLLRTVNPPPPALSAVVAESQGLRRLRALRSLSSLDKLPNVVLAVAATEPEFDRSVEARKLLVDRCGGDLTPLVEVVAAAESDSARNAVLAIMGENIRGKNAAGVVSAVSGSLGQCKPGAVGGLLCAAALVGSAEAWALLDSKVKDPNVSNRVASLRALRYWPDQKAQATLLAAAKGDAPAGVRAAAMESAIALKVRENAGLPAKAGLDSLLQNEKLIQELELTDLLLESVAKVKHAQAVVYLGRYLDDKRRCDKAAKLILACAKEMPVDHAVTTAVRLEILGPKCEDEEDRKAFAELAARLRKNAENQAPSLDKAASDTDIGL